jgi:glycosidase
MVFFRYSISLTLLLAAACASLPAQLSQNCATNSPGLCVFKVDPPDWWSGMPAPMLLLYGRNLKGAQISATGTGVSVSRSKFSDNGHYALIWLSEQSSPPQTISLRIAQAGAAITIPFQLRSPKSASAGFQGFSASDSLYLIMTDRFADGDKANDGPNHAAELAKPRGWHGGDLRGVTQHLDYLQSLGFTTIWITPVYDNEGEADSYHGYGATDLYKVDPHFGTLADLETLADALHKRHMKLVLDMVPNHVGPKHPWVDDEPEPDWFHGTKAKHDPAQSDFAALVNAHAPWRDQKDVLEGWFANVLPDMNQENPDVAQYLIQNTVWWVEQASTDGLRIDTFPYVARPFWHAYFDQLQTLFPRLTSVGEAFNPDPVITSSFAGGAKRDDLNGQVDTGLWTPFDFPTYFALRDVLLKGAPMGELARVWGADSLYPHPDRLVPFLGNHDTARFISAPGATTAEMKLGFAILLTMRGMPQIYSGDEIAMPGGDDPDNRRDFPGGFSGDKQDAFTAKGRTPEQNEMYDWVAGLLHFRNRHPVFSDGRQQSLLADASSLVYLRARDLRSGCGPNDSDRVLVAVNNADKPATLQIDPADTALAGCREFVPEAGTHVPAALKMGKWELTLGPKQSAIYSLR